MYIPGLRNKAQTVQPDVEHKQRIHGQCNAILHDPAPSQNTYAGCQRPQSQDAVDRYPHDGWHVEGGEQRGDDEREEGVADYADGLEEGTV